MNFIPEITAHLENKPGRLAKICQALAHEKVDILALSVMECGGRSGLRMVVDDVAAARRVLGSIGVEHSMNEVLVLEMDNRPGVLGRVLERLAEEHINIEYAYTSQGAGNGKSIGVFQTSNPKRARQILLDAAAASNGDARAVRRPLHAR